MRRELLILKCKVTHTRSDTEEWVMAHWNDYVSPILQSGRSAIHRSQRTLRCIYSFLAS